MSYPNNVNVVIEVSRTVLKPFDLVEARDALEAGEYVVLLAITAEDQVVVYHSSSFDAGKTEADVSNTSASRHPEGIVTSSLVVQYQRCCHHDSGKRGLKIEGVCVPGSRNC